ncbi:SGNH/GDSL hydrolase family protein [Streptomyces sp. NBC_01317]|uniref:SGNH/GDSL hydrolase family protein n=1 Tax=Streptomyces sp. NBC_01317 TaxID=2903822 RepID=UPI002E0FD8F0|nr:SGNH/GDSL hydrolase family protein [Streptomyces sp. NBC_01317]
MKRTPHILAAGAAALIMTGVQTGVQGTASAAPAAGPWTGTWAAAPQSGGDTFTQQTVRQIVRTSIAGTSARVRLSNVFGNAPLTVQDIHVARRTSGSSVSAATDRTVTFGGQRTVTIPAGGSAVSDEVAFPVDALSDVAVSFHLPRTTGPVTYHQSGLQTNYVAAGDVSGNANLTNARTTNSYYFLSGLDVVNPAAEGAVVTLGASITDGIASRNDANRRWPNELASRLVGAGRTVGVLNQGISGNQLLTDGAGQSALNRFDRDVLSQPGVRWVVFADDPINDLSNTNPTADRLIGGLKQLIARAHERGVKFLCSTLTPFEGAGGWKPELETKRAAVNSFVRGAGSGCDGVIDQDAATHDPARPTKFRAEYDSGDHLHPNEAGLRAIAGAVDPALLR